MTPSGAKVAAMKRALIENRYVRYKEGAKMYNIGLNKFQDQSSPNLCVNCS